MSERMYRIIRTKDDEPVHEQVYEQAYFNIGNGVASFEAEGEDHISHGYVQDVRNGYPGSGYDLMVKVLATNDYRTYHRETWLVKFLPEEA
jgi:hypothetical protein